MDKSIMLKPPIMTLSHLGTTRVNEHSGLRTQCKKCQANVTNITSTTTCSTHAMQTRGIAASLCRDAVFNTLELLEGVLLNLMPAEILVARRVNAHWNAVIMTSPRTQRKLFLLAETTFTTWDLDEHDKVISVDASGRSNRHAGEWTVPARLNNLLFATSPPHLRESLIERIKRCETIYLCAPPSVGNKTSIYHKMLLSQPPSKEVEFNFYYDKSKKPGRKKFRSYSDDRINVRVVNERGVTFGDILRAFRAGVERDAEDGSSSGYVIKIRSSTLYMGGVVFPSEEEMVTVNGGTS